MPDAPHTPKPRTCPHCGKVILAVRRPRDLGLLLNCLMYRVPPEAAITEQWIETARSHCRMKTERLAELRSGPFTRFWSRMIERRSARLAYLKEHGELPPRWAGLMPGEPDHLEALNGFHRYRKGGLAKMKARLRKRPERASDDLAARYLKSRRIKSKPRRSAALDQVTARLCMMVGAEAGTLKLREYEVLKSIAAPARPRLDRKPKAGKMDLPPSSNTQKTHAQGSTAEMFPGDPNAAEES